MSPPPPPPVIAFIAFLDVPLFFAGLMEKTQTKRRFFLKNIKHLNKQQTKKTAHTRPSVVFYPRGRQLKKKSLTPVVGGWVRGQKSTRVKFIFSDICLSCF
jgi:hypothetical protein